MVHTNATNVPGGGPRDGEKQADAMQLLGQDETDCVNTFELVVVVLLIAMSNVTIGAELSTYVHNVPPVLPCFNLSEHTQTQIYATDARRWTENAMPTVST